MKVDITHIQQLIVQGENTNVEFKSARLRAESLAKEIVAFANASGGVILLGVEDTKEISGLDREKNYEEWCMNIARNNINPPIQLSYSRLDLDGKTIGVLEVPKGADKPYQTSDAKFLIRVGSTNRMATVNELMRLFQQSGVFHFDSTPIEGTSARQLNFQKISAYFTPYKIDFEMLSEEEKIALLKNIDILKEEGEVSVAGLMIFGINPQKHLLNASVSFAHFAGTEITAELLDKQNIEGTLELQIDTTCAVIKNNLRRASNIVGTKRVERNLYPDKVFRELIVNACCHRNYAIFGSKIRVFLFDDRLEVISPGRLPNTVTIEKLKAGVSYAVNPVIVKFMENLNYMDKLGRGLPMVYAEARQRGRDVLFEEIGEEFKVTLFL
ncbi:MAG: transcriptional regulator [bacterium]|nr:transcriptional regulator [bacterium]